MLVFLPEKISLFNFFKKKKTAYCCLKLFATLEKQIKIWYNRDIKEE
jgi:hypothetical protein